MLISYNRIYEYIDIANCWLPFKKDSAQLTKEKISIGLLGQKRFYLGLSIGLFLAVLTYLFFGYFREILRGQTFDSDLLIPTETEFLIYNLFFAAVSVTFGFGVTVWFWFHGLLLSQRQEEESIT